MRGAIFMCNKQTRHECFKRKVFGLPATKLNFVKQIKKGMILFLFDTDDRKMYGVYEAISDGGMNYAPNAYEKTGSRFPAQVRFRIIWKCWYLTEAEFKPAIIANYFTSNKFNQHLSFEQVSQLLSLFEAKKKTADEESRSPRTSSSANHSPRTSSRLSSNPNPSFNPDSYQFQSSNFDSRRLSSNPNPDPERYQYQSSNSDSMRLSSNPNPNPDPYQYQSSNTDNMRLSSYPNANPFPYQFQMSNLDNNMHLSSNANLNLNPASYQYSTHASLYQYQYDPNNPGIASSSAYNTQNNQQNQTGTISEPKCETGLNSNQDHTKPHPHCDYCAIKNKGEYNSSSQSMQFYTSTPQNYNNITMGGEGSNMGEGLQHQSHICNQVPENFYSSVFERLQGIPSAQQNPDFVLESPNPNPRLYADSERPSVFSRLIVKEQKVETKPNKNDEEPSIDQLLFSLREKSNQWSGERKGKPKSNQWINDKTMKSVIEKKPSTEIEAKEESGSDGNKMDVDFIEPSLEKFELGESQIPFLNFKRRSGERKVSAEPGEEGSKKKRRFVRPRLEIEGSIRKIDTSFDEVMKEAETKETNVEKKDSKEAETEARNEEKKNSKEAEIELEFGAPNMHEFEAKTEEKMVTVPEFMEIGSEKQKYDLQGHSCRNGISKDIKMDCELGPITAEPQEEGEIIFLPLLQINEELLENMGPTQNDNLSSNECKHNNVEEYTAFNQESDVEKNRTEKEHVDKNLSVIELETKIEVGEIELGVENDNEKLNLVEKEAQNFMQINPISNCCEVLELGDKKEQKNDNTNLNVTKLAPKRLMEISPVKFYGEVAKLGEKIEEKQELTGIECGIPKEQTESKFMIPKDATEPESEILKTESGLKSVISDQEAGPKSGIPNQDAELKSWIANQEAKPKSEIPKAEAELKPGIPDQETELKSRIPKEAKLKSGIPNLETELKSETLKNKTKPESEILKEESEPTSGNSKPGLGFDIRSIIRKAKAEKLNEAAGPCKDKDEFINGDFIALD